MIWQRHGVVERNRVDIVCCLSTMHERDRQTDKQTNHGTVISIALGEIAYQHCRLQVIRPGPFGHHEKYISCSLSSWNVKITTAKTLGKRGPSPTVALRLRVCLASRNLPLVVAYNYCAEFGRCAAM